MSQNFIGYFFLNLYLQIVFFIRRWYLDSFYFWHQIGFNLIRTLDRYFALKITIRHWFKPLYQDYTTLGYILGFIFRTGRIISAGLIYFLFILLISATYLFWIFIPIFLILRIILP